jgi:hypothetical protein
VVFPTTAIVFLQFFSEMCCEAKRWKPSAEPIADPALYQRFPKRGKKAKQQPAEQYPAQGYGAQLPFP